jgi:hypoxanthine phosphoribosyltransferase
MGIQPKPQILISRREIKATVKNLADEIAKDYRGKNPLLIGVLKGAFIFMADLIRLLDIPLEIDFIRLSSYGQGTESSGKIRVVQDISTQIEGRNALVVEDIVDTGYSLTFLLGYLKEKKPASLKLCVLADKPSRRQVPVPIDYLGFTVPNKFLVGYGLDWSDKYRNLPDICTLGDEE